MEDSRKIIVVAEDDNMLRNIVVSQLTPEYKMLPARDGQEALMLISQHRPNLVVLDIMLPKLDGFGVLERLRALPDPELSGTPVIVVSNLADPQSRARAEAYGIEAYFTKAEITLGSLVSRIKHVLGETQPPMGPEA